MKKYILVAIITLAIITLATFSLGKSASATVIFQNNFDSSPDANSCGNVIPTGWAAWMNETGCSGTFDGVSHYAGEVSFPGRGGTGKSLKQWRASTLFPGYDGGLYAAYSNNFNPTSNNFYVRWTMKIPSAATIDFTNAGAVYQKLFRLNMNGGSGELYFFIMTPYTSRIFPTGGVIAIGPFLHTDPILGYQSTNYTVLGPTDFAPLVDEQWHFYELHVDSTANTVEFWVDGILKHRNTNLPMSPQSPQWIQHFGFGNRASGSVEQSSWQVWEFDDLVIADQYIGPLGGGTTPYCGDGSCNNSETCSSCASDCGSCADNQAPTIPASLSATAVSSSQINLSWTASTDNVGVTGYRIYRGGTQIGTSGTNSYQNTGLSPSTSYSYTVAAYDAAGNVSGQSSSASATTQASAGRNGRPEQRRQS
jgi:hypothetical protein